MKTIYMEVTINYMAKNNIDIKELISKGIVKQTEVSKLNYLVITTNID